MIHTTSKHLRHCSCCVRSKLESERSNSSSPVAGINDIPSSLPHCSGGTSLERLQMFQCKGRLTLISPLPASVAVLHGEFGANDAMEDIHRVYQNYFSCQWKKKYSAKHDLHFYPITYVFILILCFYCSEITNTNTYRKQGIKKSRFNIGTVQEHISK